jgi:hypothetical protein
VELYLYSPSMLSHRPIIANKYSTKSILPYPQQYIEKYFAAAADLH